MDTNEITRSFPVTGPARLTVRNVDGLIDLAAGDADVLTVLAVKHPGAGANQTEIEISQDAAGQVSVITRYVDDWLARLFHPLHPGPARVDYTIRLPRNCQVDVGFVSGSAQLHGLAGEFNLRAVSGAIDVQDLAGRLNINTVSGPVTGARLRLEGSLAVDTVSADVVLSDSTLPAVAAHSVSGQVRLETGLGAGPYLFNSVSGDVWLTVPANAACQVAVHSLSGSLHAGLPASQILGNSRGNRVTFGSGTGPEVSLHSVSGDLHLTTAGGGAAAKSEPPITATASPAPADSAAADRLAILDRLARGELSVDDAVRTLKQ